jgi:DNA-binding NarL/FixJ family response regulator
MGDGADMIAGLRGWRVVVQAQLDAYHFTPAEQRVAWMLFDAHTNIGIGMALDSTPQTIKNHMTRILHNTKTSNRLELALLLLHLDGEELPQPGLPPATWVRHRRSTP